MCNDGNAPMDSVAKTYLVKRAFRETDPKLTFISLFRNYDVSKTKASEDEGT